MFYVRILCTLYNGVIFLVGLAISWPENNVRYSGYNPCDVGTFISMAWAVITSNTALSPLWPLAHSDSRGTGVRRIAALIEVYSVRSTYHISDESSATAFSFIPLMHVKTSSEAFCRNAGDLFHMKCTRLKMHISLFHANFCVCFFFCMSGPQTIHPSLQILSCRHTLPQGHWLQLLVCTHNHR